MKFKEAKNVVKEFNRLWPGYGASYIKPDEDVPSGGVMLDRLGNNPDLQVSYLESIFGQESFTGSGWIQAFSEIDCGLELQLLQVSPEAELLEVLTAIVANEYTFLRTVLAPINNVELSLQNSFKPTVKTWEHWNAFGKYLKEVGRIDIDKDLDFRCSKLAKITLEKSRTGLLNYAAELYFEAKANPAREHLFQTSEVLRSDVEDFAPIEAEVRYSHNPEYPLWNSHLPSVQEELEKLCLGSTFEVGGFELEYPRGKSSTVLGIDIERLDGTHATYCLEDGVYFMRGALGEKFTNKGLNTFVVAESSRLEKVVTIAFFEAVHISKILMPLSEEALNLVAEVPKKIRKQLAKHLTIFETYFAKVIAGEEVALDTWSFKAAKDATSFLQEHRKSFEALPKSLMDKILREMSI